MDVDRRDGVFVYVRVGEVGAVEWLARAHAVVREAEGVTLVLEREVATGASLPFEFEAAWLTVRASTELAAVGITAAISVALAAAGIPANVVAGFGHDHVLVPVADGDRAIEVLRGLPDRGPGPGAAIRPPRPDGG